MFWWIATVICIVGALLIQYLCSSKILRMKQAISIKSIALRDVRDEGQRLDEQEIELKNQQTSLKSSIHRLRTDIKDLLNRAKEKGLEVPDANFPLEELDEEEEAPREE
jgi:predicted  nucleic acid-binding Zn-ribbon protein